MKRQIYNIFDLIMRLIVICYGVHFLKFVGIEEDIKYNSIDKKIVTIFGKRVRLDFLCRLKNNVLQNIEFHRGPLSINALLRYYLYNIFIEGYIGGIANTLIFRFCSYKDDISCVKIGKNKHFHFSYFYLGDVYFDEIFKNINIKVETYKKSELKDVIKLTYFEEITLLLSVLVEGFDDYVNAFKYICELVEMEELFNVDTYPFFKYILKLEINNFLTHKEKENIKRKIIYEKVEDIKMSPSMELLIRREYFEAIEKDKELYGEKIAKDSFADGQSKGFDDGLNSAYRNVALSLKGILGVDEISRITNLSIEELGELGIY